MANRRSLSQFSLDGLLINGLQVRVLPGSPLSHKDLAHFLTSRPLLWGLLWGLLSKIAIRLARNRVSALLLTPAITRLEYHV